MHLAIHPQEAPVGVDHGGRIPVDAGALPLKERHDQHHRQLPGKRLERVGRRARDRLGQVEAVGVLRLAEIGGVEQLFQADDLRPPASGLAHQTGAASQVGGGVRIGPILNDSDGKRGVGHGSSVRGVGRNP